MFPFNQNADENPSPWESVNKFPSTVSSLVSGIGVLAKKEKLLDLSSWKSLLQDPLSFSQTNGNESASEASITKSSDSANNVITSEGNGLGSAQASASIEQRVGGEEEEEEEGAAAEKSLLEQFVQTLTVVPNFFRREQEPASSSSENKVGNDSDHQGKEQAPELQKPTPLVPKEVLDPRSWIENVPPSTPPAQSEQKKIKQDLITKINEGVPKGEGATEKKILEHKVKNLYAIFSELKYQRIDEILQKTTSTSYTPQDKIDEVKKFQKEFIITFPIDANNLDNVLDHLSLEIKQKGLVVDDVNLSSTKFTPTSYNQTELLNHLIHSKHYLDGILENDGINVKKRIEAAKLFVKQLELVSEPDKSDMAEMHTKFVKFQEEKDSRDVTKIVDEGAKFAKSIEALASGDKHTSFLDAAGSVSNQSHFHNSVVLHEVGQRDVVIRKFTERLSELSAALESPTLIDKAKTDEIFKKTIINCRRDPETKKITFPDPKSPVVAGVAGGVGAGADTPTGAAPANLFPGISFVGLSNEDIFRRSFYLRYVTEGIMEAEGEAEDKKKAIESLIAEMKFTTNSIYSNQNACYNNHIKTMASGQDGNVLLDNATEDKKTKEVALKNIGAELLKRVANESTNTVLMSDLTMEKIYKNTGLVLETPIIDDNSMEIITKMGNEDIPIYIKAVQEFQEKEIKEILKKTDVDDSTKTQEIKAILKLSLTYDDHSSQLKIKTTNKNLKEIETLKNAIKDDNKPLRDDSRLMQSYFSNLYKGALETPSVGDDQKILGLKAINAINSVANFDRSFLDFVKIKDQKSAENAIASGKAITQAVKSSYFNDNGEIVATFSWKDTGEIDQGKLQTAYAKYLKKEKAGDAEEIKSKGALWSCIPWSMNFVCCRLKKPKELTEEEIKKRKSELCKLAEIEIDTQAPIITEPKPVRKNNTLYRITKTTMDNILTQDREGVKGKLKLLSELMSFRTDSLDNFFDDFSKNPDLKVPDTESYSENLGIGSSNSTNYFQKFCQAILDSKNENKIDDNKKFKALKLFLTEQKNTTLDIINLGIANGNTTDKEIKTKAQAFLEAVSKKKASETVYSDDRIKAKMEKSKTPTPAAAPAHAAPATTPATTPAPVLATASAAAAVRT